MRSVGRKHTRPEMVVRRAVHRLGRRYKLHDTRLPGSPDLVFPRLQKVIFVHGCFWHHHEGCKKASVPTARREYWLAKFKRNEERDEKNMRLLRESGWSALVIWECETRDAAGLECNLRSFLELND